MSWAVSMAGSETNVDVQNNCSYINAKFTVKTSGSTYNNNDTAWYQISCDGHSTGHVGFRIGKSTSKSFTATLGPFYHEADGSLSNRTLNGYLNCNSAGDHKTASCQVAMTTIPRKSDFSISGTTLGSNTHVYISRASGSFYHTIIYQCGNAYAEYYNAGDGYDFTRPFSDAEQFGAYNSSRTATITVITYNNGSEIGRVSKDYAFSIPDTSSTNPNQTSATGITDSLSSISTKFGFFVQNKSKPTFTFHYAGRYGAGISNYTLIINNRTYSSSSSSITIDPITESGSISYRAQIRDTRGYTNTETGTIYIKEYTPPQIVASVERTGSTGTTASVNLNGSITALEDLNDKTCAIKYKSHTSTTWNSQTVAFDEDEYTIQKTVEIPIADNLSYDFKVECTDFFQTVSTEEIPISTVFDLMHFGNDGESLAIGKKVERTKSLEIELDLYYKGISIDDYIRSIINERNG